jgi:hypothetical protein
MSIVPSLKLPFFFTVPREPSGLWVTSAIFAAEFAAFGDFADVSERAGDRGIAGAVEGCGGGGGDRNYGPRRSADCHGHLLRSGSCPRSCGRGIAFTGGELGYRVSVNPTMKS